MIDFTEFFDTLNSLQQLFPSCIALLTVTLLSKQQVVDLISNFFMVLVACLGH